MKKTIWKLRDADGVPGGVTDPAPAVDPNAAPAVDPNTPPADTDPPPDPNAEPGTKTVPLAALEDERRKRQELERQNEYLKGLAEGRTAPATVTPEPAKEAGPPPEPTLENFGDNFQEFDKARDRWLIEVAKWEAKEEFKKENVVSQQVQAKQQRIAKFQERVAEAAKLDPELPLLVQNYHVPGPYHIPLSSAMADAVLESEVGPQLLRHLKNNPELAMKLANSPSPVSAIRELGQIEGAILNKPKPETKKISQAPEPTTDVKSTSAPITDLSNESTEDYIKRRNQQIYGKPYR